jgi:hypothetical protein
LQQSDQAILKELFASARGVEGNGPDTRHSAGERAREICADDLRWDGRSLEPLSQHRLFQAHPIKLVDSHITPETQIRKHK